MKTIRIQKNRPNPELYRWNVSFIIEPAWSQRYALSYTIGCFKLISYPPQGEMLSKENYKGFLFRGNISTYFDFGFSFNFPKRKGLMDFLSENHKPSLTDSAPTLTLKKLKKYFKQLLK